MMNRYSNTIIKRKPNGDRVYSYTLYPKIPIQNSDIFINPTYGDRLENLANQYYGDPSLWWIIAQANGIKGFTAIYSENFSGEIRIPTEIQDIIDEFEEING